MMRPRQTSRDTTLLLIAWAAWLIGSLLAVSNVIPDLLGLVACAVIWCGFAAATLYRRSRVTLSALMISTIIAALGLISDVDLAIRVALSNGPLRRLALAELPPLWPQEPQRAGLFVIQYRDEYDGARLLATQSWMLEDFGIAYIPDERPPDDESGMYRFWHVYGPWFGYEWDG
jgi:hypothetical protein